MRYCTNCGARIAGGRYCGQCGAPVDSAFGGSVQGAGFDIGDFHLTDRHLGVLAYLTPLPAIVFLLIDPYRTSPFLRFHSCQCLLLTAAAVLMALISVTVSFFALLEGLLSFAFQSVLLCCWVLAAYRAFQGRTYRLPVIGEIAQRFA